MAGAPYTFLSYSRLDQAFAIRLGQDLRARGVQIWFDQLDISPGATWDEEIERALQGADTVVFIVSQNSVESDNVLNELSLALDSGKRIIPIMIAHVQVPLRMVRLQRIDFTRDYASALLQLAATMTRDLSRTNALEVLAKAPVTYPPTYTSESGHPPHHSPVPGTPAPAAGSVDRRQAVSNFQASGPSAQPDRAPVRRSSHAGLWILLAIVGAALGAFVLIFVVGVLFAAAAHKSPSSDTGALPTTTTDSTARSANDAPARAATLEALAGTWVTDCKPAQNQLHSRQAMAFEGTTLTFTVMFFSANDCNDKLYAVRLVADIIAISARSWGIYDTDYRLRRLALVPIASAARLNAARAFGAQDWQDGVARDLSPAVVTQLVGAPLAAGDVYYDLLSIQGDVLYEGLTQGRVARTAADRPASVDTGTQYRRR